jgi:hypothetical protein
MKFSPWKRKFLPTPVIFSLYSFLIFSSPPFLTFLLLSHTFCLFFSFFFVVPDTTLKEDDYKKKMKGWLLVGCCDVRNNIYIYIYIKFLKQYPFFFSQSFLLHLLFYIISFPLLSYSITLSTFFSFLS